MPVFTLALLSCSSVRIGYNYADWIIPWYLNSYFDLNSNQKTWVSARLDNLLNWHRKEELPKYVQHLDEINKKASDGISSNEIDWGYQLVMDLFNETSTKLLPDVTDFLWQLTPDQINNLEKKLGLNRAEQDKENQKKTPAERKEERLNKTVESIEEWTGKLTDSQKSFVKQRVAQLPETSPYNRRERDRRNTEFISLLRDKKDKATFQNSFGEWWSKPQVGREVQYVEIIEIRTEKIKELVFETDKLLSSDQRKRALNRLNDFRSDFASLSKK